MYTVFFDLATNTISRLDGATFASNLCTSNHRVYQQINAITCQPSRYQNGQTSIGSATIEVVPIAPTTYTVMLYNILNIIEGQVLTNSMVLTINAN